MKKFFPEIAVSQEETIFKEIKIVDDSMNALFNQFREKLDTALQRLATAIRSGDQTCS